MKDVDAAGCPLVAVAIDRDKGSQNALKWAVDNLAQRGQTITLVHVNTKFSNSSKNQEDPATGYKIPTDPQMKELFLPFRCFCTRKDVQCRDIVIEETDVAKAVVEFVTNAAIEKLVVGAPSRGGFVRFKNTDVSNSISKGAPDFCTVYVISKGKVSSMRNSVRPAPQVSPFRAQIQNQVVPNQGIPKQVIPVPKPGPADQPRFLGAKGGAATAPALAPEPHFSQDESIRSPFTRGSRGPNTKSYAELSFTDSDASYVSSGRPSTDRMYPPRLSTMSSASDSFDMGQTPKRSVDSYSFGNDFSSYASSYSQSSSGTGTSWSSNNLEDVDNEMKRLKLELKQTMDMYSSACKEALTAKQRAMELHRWKMEEQQRIEESRLTEEAAMQMVERERAKCRAAIEAAEASRRIAELESQKRISAEKSNGSHKDLRYRKYSIEEIEKATDYFADNRKVGEGGYGPVYKAYLDHTHVAIKVLRPDAAQGKSQFDQEVEVLSTIRHPNMVLLLGACPEYGCLVYEYMANGSLEDRLFRKGGSPVIPWQHRFRIAAEIASGLLFLHQTKPEPLVHRDLKPANILLDRNYVSKISDVGLARLVPPSVADNVTQYLMTSTAGTFCYIDPEYQQTGMLGVKSDIYSLGIMLLQIITSKAPMGLTHIVERSIEKGTFHEVLDPAVEDWPVEEAKVLAEMALQCAELRRKDRPDLARVVLPELDRLRTLGEDCLQDPMLQTSTRSAPMHSQFSQDSRSDPLLRHSAYESSRSR